MAAAVRVRGDYEAAQIRVLAKRSQNAAQTRRLLALAAIYEGGSRTEAARIGGVGLQTVRDWVLAFNAEGPPGLVNGKAPGNASLLNEQQRQTLHRSQCAARERRGSLDFDTVELALQFDEHGKIVRIVPAPRNDAHRLIEECMLAANVCAAHFLAGHEQPALYRIHDGPPPDKLAVLREFLAGSGLTLTGGDEPTAMDYAALIDRIRERPDFALLQTVLLRSLSQAQYSPDNIGHFGLAYEAYAHFTSPIRRYPDLLVHRAIKAVLAGKRYAAKDASWQELGVHCSQTERRADDASRDVLQWLKCHYMRDRIGESFAGTISGVASFGIFVTLDGLDIDGLVHVTELPRDYFHFDAVRHALIGERSGRVFQLAGRVGVKIARVDLERAKIDFTLDDSVEPSAPHPVAARPAMAEPASRSGGALAAARDDARPRAGNRAKKARRGQARGASRGD